MAVSKGTTYVVGNWKSFQATEETKGFANEIKTLKPRIESLTGKKLIVCPPFTQLAALKQSIEEQGLPIALGAQNVSRFTQGAHTGEINAEQLKEFVEYVIIGHSERRGEQKESDEELKEKTERAHEQGITVIYCVSDPEQEVPQKADIIAYEPLDAIGTGKPADPENAQEKISKIMEKTGKEVVLYGGSVKPENVNDYTSKPEISGVLVGGASLKATSFVEIAEHA